MRTEPSRPVRQLLLWGLLFAALIPAFRRLAPTEAAALLDESTALTVLTEDGPVAMTMAEYLPGAVAGEMPVSFGPEALKAQAVAARTYGLAAHRHPEADICTDSACCLAWRSAGELRELWGDDYEANRQAVAAAVRATDGQYLAYEGEAIQAVFHASSAGATEASGAIWAPLPYLVSVSSPETAETVPGFLSERRFTPEELAARLGIQSADPPADWLQGVETDDAGRVATLHIAGQALTGTFVRGALGLKSTAFEARWEDGTFLFTAAGSGHGVGMSQYGAALLAGEGWTYDRILAHYYPGTELVTG